jgi:hypothetical protein
MIKPKVIVRWDNGEAFEPDFIEDGVLYVMTRSLWQPSLGRAGRMYEAKPND